MSVNTKNARPLARRFVKLVVPVIATVMVFSAHPSVISSPSPASAESVISQLGADIDGEAAGDRSGWSISLNSDGTRVAIGANLNDGTTGVDDDNRGHTRIYQYNSDTSSWEQLGADIDGEAAGDQSGFSVSLSSDGSRVAIGAYGNDGTGPQAGHTRIYEYDGVNDDADGIDGWTQLGADIDGEDNLDNSGYSVSLSSDGSRVAIGAAQNDGSGLNAGHTRIYQYNSDTSSWEQLGADIDGEAAEDQLGSSVSLSADGSRVAIGAASNDGSGLNAGHTRIYQYNSDTSSWEQLGADIDGEAAGDQSGFSVSLSSDGTRVAIGANFNDGTTGDDDDNRGHTRIYQYNSDTSSWEQLGADIDGEAAGDQSGNSVSLSADGSRVAIGAVTNDGSGLDAGHARIFEYDSNNGWTQLGADIDGEAAGDRLARHMLSLSSDGSRLAVGAPFNDGNGADAGHSRVFAINAVAENRQRESSEETGEPGIFLTLTGRASDPSQGFGVTFGAYAVEPSSPYVLAIRNEQSGTQRVLASGTVSAGGHLEASIQLPQLQTGSFTITLTARSAVGAFLPLGNRIVVDGQGNIQSVSPEALQPRIR